MKFDRTPCINLLYYLFKNYENNTGDVFVFLGKFIP
jgi:hypothetical protein